VWARRPRCTRSTSPIPPTRSWCGNTRSRARARPSWASASRSRWARPSSATKATNLVVAQTNNGGSGGTGVVATALNLETGSQAWKFSYLYPSPPRGDSAALPLPTNGIPGGAVGVDLDSQGYTTDVAMGDLYGNLWRLNAATGASRTAPAFRCSSSRATSTRSHGPGDLQRRRQPVRRVRLGRLHRPDRRELVGRHAVAGRAEVAETGPYPIAETSVTKLAFKEDLAAGTNAFAQVQVIGEQLFLTSDTSDINASTYGTGSSDTGRVITYNLATTGSSTVIVRGGAGSLANAGTTLYSSSVTASRRSRPVPPRRPARASTRRPSAG